MSSRKRVGKKKGKKQGTLKSRSIGASPLVCKLPELGSRYHLLFELAWPLSIQPVPSIEDFKKCLLNKCSNKKQAIGKRLMNNGESLPGSILD